MSYAATMPIESDVSLQDYFGGAFSGGDAYLRSTGAKDSLFERFVGKQEVAQEIRLPASEQAQKRANLRRMAAAARRESSSESTLMGHNLFERHEEFFERKIKSFLSLTDDWDGDGARAIPMPAIYASLNYMEEIKNSHLGLLTVGISPSPDGEVLIYWHSANAYAELNFDENGECTFCFGVGKKKIEVLEEHPNENIQIAEREIVKSVIAFLEKNFTK